MYFKNCAWAEIYEFDYLFWQKQLYCLAKLLMICVYCFRGIVDFVCIWQSRHGLHFWHSGKKELLSKWPFEGSLVLWLCLSTRLIYVGSSCITLYECNKCNNGHKILGLTNFSPNFNLPAWLTSQGSGLYTGDCGSKFQAGCTYSSGWYPGNCFCTVGLDDIVPLNVFGFTIVCASLLKSGNKT